MLTIHKFPVEVVDFPVIELPIGARVLTVQAQYGNAAFIWALVDTLANKEKRKFRLAGTGHVVTAEDAAKYIGTFQLHGGEYVFHLFECAQ